MKNYIISNIDEAKHELLERPINATTIERETVLFELKDRYAGEPQPIRYGHLLYDFLDKVSTPIGEHDLIAGRSVNRELSDEEEKFFKEFHFAADNPRYGVFIGYGHATLGWEDVVSLGLGGLRKRAEESLADKTDPEKRSFLEGIILVYGAIENYIKRYERAARDMGKAELADALSRARGEGEMDFRAALQLLFIIAFIDCAYLTPNSTLTLGRLDRILYPLYRKGIDEGSLTREEAAEYITDYYCKHNLIMGRGEHQIGDASNSTTFDRIYAFDAPQYLILAGTEVEGKSSVNELTELFAECIVPEFKNPVVVVRYFKGLDSEHPKLWKLLTEKALASSSLMFYNDSDVVGTYMKIGMPEEDARACEYFGCNWPTTGANGYWMNTGLFTKKCCPTLSDREKEALSTSRYFYRRSGAEHGWCEVLCDILSSLADKNDLTMEDVYSAFFEKMSGFMDIKLSEIKYELDRRRRFASTIMCFGDPFSEIAVKNGEALYAGGTKYHYDFQSFMLFGSVVDCFTAVDKLVFRDRSVTVKRLMEAVNADFEGYEDVLALARAAGKFGSGDELSNMHARRLSRAETDMAIEKSRPYFESDGIFITPCMQSDTWGLKWGNTYGATPDGRRAGEAFSQNSQPAPGSASEGLTAMLGSLLNISFDSMLSGALNLDVQPKQFEGEKGRALFASILAAYFNAGGLHAQVSSVSVEDLLDAQVCPMKHKDLRVRVTGYSGIFVDIPKRLQDNIIDRMKG